MRLLNCGVWLVTAHLSALNGLALPSSALRFCRLRFRRNGGRALRSLIVQCGSGSTIRRACLHSQIAVEKVDPDRCRVAWNTEGVGEDRAGQDCRQLLRAKPLRMNKLRCLLSRVQERDQSVRAWPSMPGSRNAESPARREPRTAARCGTSAARGLANGMQQCATLLNMRALPIIYLRR